MDDQDDIIKRKSFLLMVLPFAIAGFLWGGMYFANLALSIRSSIKEFSLDGQTRCEIRIGIHITLCQSK